MTPSKPIRAVELAGEVWVDRIDLHFSFSRAGGPGGQAVNKLSTRTQLRVSVEAIVGLTPAARTRLRRRAGQRLTQGDELVFSADTRRSQLDNKRACVQRLRSLVADALAAPKERKPTEPSRAEIEKRLAEKRRLSRKKEARRKPDLDNEGRG
ncbi:MAG: alternative ribosome rescue aminoacyl-tRNA hydrolase ArfB [Planctomycetota bacterium]|jgi:ribosome-associated protein